MNSWTCIVYVGHVRDAILNKDGYAKNPSLFKDFQHMTEDSFSFIQDNYISTTFFYIIL